MFYPFPPKLKPEQNKKSINNNPNIDYINKIKQSFKDESNDYCVECGDSNPNYISINNSVFLCKECILNHLQLSQEASTIIRNDIKILTLNEIHYIYNGGNKKLLDFINNEFPKLKEFPPQILYNTKAMDYYRKNLKYLTEGGIAPIKPSLKEAYTLIEKKQDYDIIDTELDVEDRNEILIDNNDEEDYKDIEIGNINRYNDENNKKFVKTNNYHYNEDYICFRNKKNMRKKKDEQYNENKFNHTVNNKIDIYSLSNLKETKEINKYNSNNKKDNDSSLKKSNTNAKLSGSFKSIKFNNNYNNFDNENFYNNTTITSDTIDFYSTVNLNKNDNKSKENLNIKNGFLSPQTTLTFIKNSNTDINMANNVYYKPKAPSYFKKYKFKINSNILNTYTKNNYNKINDINISEFNINENKNNLNDNKNYNNDKKNIKRIKNNDLFNIKIEKEDEEEYNKKSRTYNRDNNNIIQNNKTLSKLDKDKTINYCKDSKLKININRNKIKKENEENIRNNKENDSNPHISVNIAHYKIIKNVNNYNINLGNSKNDKNEIKKNEKKRTYCNCHKENENKNSDNIISREILSNNDTIPKIKTQKEEIKTEKNTLKEEKTKAITNKKLFEYKNNTYNNTEDKNEINYKKNHLRYYHTFIVNSSINKEKNNFKYNHKLVKVNNDSIEKKNYSFNNLREKYKCKEKEKTKKIIDISQNIMDINYKGNILNESIRNKYKKKNLNSNKA